MFHHCFSIAEDYSVDSTLLQQSFQPSGATPCLVLTAADDLFVEPSEILTVRVGSFDGAVILGADVIAEVTILDASPGEQAHFVAIDSLSLILH